MSRPAGQVGEVHQALLAAARELATPERAPTVAELAAHAQVGQRAALNTVKNMRRRGQLRIVRTRRVEHTTKPVAEYAPVDGPQAHPVSPKSFEFGALLGAWISS